MSMGGGDSGGGAIVQQTNPTAAYLSGFLGKQAADSASNLMSEQINNAIKGINSSYRDAALSIKPYTQTGIESLDKLLQYQGLDPYMPTNPGEAPTLQSELAKVTNQAANSYLRQNSQQNIVTMADTIGKKNALITGQQPILQWQYTGKGADDPNLQAWSANTSAAQGTPNYSAPGFLSSPRQTYIATANSPEQAFQGTGLLDIIKNQLAQQSLDEALPIYQQKKTDYDQAAAWAEQYGVPLTTQQITDEITNQPGYQAELGQGVQAIQNAAGARGYLGSGRILKELSNFGQNTLSQYYGNTLNRLATTAGMGANAAQSLAGIKQGQGNALASLYNSLGETQANAQLSGANALAQGMVAANQNYSIMGGGGGGGGGMGGIGSVLSGIGSLAAFSSKTLKEKIHTINTAEILDKVSQLDLDKWKYKGINQEFIGPYAEQFSELFHTGDGKTINLIDAVGVLLGAVKELNHKLNKLTVRA